MVLTSLRDAPSPPARFPDGHLRAFARDPLLFLTTAARLGPVVRLRFATTPACLLSEPGLIEELLVARQRDFVKASPVRAHRLLFGNGLFTNEGDSWRRQRRLAQPAFHRDRIVAAAAVMTDAAGRMLDAWTDGETREIHGEMTRLTSAIAARALFGADVEQEAPDLAASLESVMRLHEERRGLARLVPERIPIPAHIRYRQAVRRLDAIVERFIRRRRASGESRDDLLGLLLQTRDEDGSGLDDRQLRDEVLTLFVGAYDTPALALTWLIYLVATHPHVAAGLESEIEHVLGGATPQPDDVSDLRYVSMAVDEALRVYPPAWLLAREAVRATSLGGFAIPAGTMVLASPWVLHRDPRFFERPEAFVPERWSEGFEKRLPKYAYFPFGAGPRVCIGAGFARMQTVLVITMILQRFRLEAASGSAALRPAFTLRPRDGVRVRLSARRSASSVGAPAVDVLQ
ncbi:MAG TPA: cytochrome P450 [Vicinamibacterales bacterium]|nr:cytochrome P450 [Vicinamibacterales bacterium]